MFRLNLLPESQKRDVRYEIYSRFLTNFGLGLISVFIVFSILLVPTFIILLFQKGDLKRDLEVEKQSQENNRVSEIELLMENNNELINSLNQIESGVKIISPLIAGIFSLGIKNVALTDFKYTLSPKEAIINGKAAEIKNFLDFKDELSKLPEISEVISSPQNLIRLKNVVFTLRVKLK